MWYNMLKLSNGGEFSPDILKDQLFQKLLKEKLHDWLLHKVAEGGKGPSVLDKDGQSVLHLTAALGYDWAIKPTRIAGVSVSFRGEWMDSPLLGSLLWQRARSFLRGHARRSS